MPRLPLALIAALAIVTGAEAQGYPTKSLRIVVPFAPGGSTDIFARLIGERLSSALGQPVVIENRAGAAGNIGADAVAKAPPDGYTLLMATTGVMAINNALYKTMSYDAAKDLEPVVFVASITNVLIVAADSPLKSVGDLIAAAKEAPGKLTFASSGAGSSTHMSAELFKAMAGVDLLHVPYKGSGQALTGRHRRARVDDVREHAAAPCRTSGAASCACWRHRPQARCGAARRPDRRGVGSAGLRIALLERHRGARRERRGTSSRDSIARSTRSSLAPEMRQKLADQGAERDRRSARGLCRARPARAREVERRGARAPNIVVELSMALAF